ncbi:MAG: exodeoxyribonuclease III [Magnetovibrionaceae bacterium]
MKIATWNVNSVKARTQHLLDWVQLAEPDVVLLQELKCQDEAFPRLEVESLGYHVSTKGQKTYNGVAVLSRMPHDVIIDHLPGEDTDEQARYLEVALEGMDLRVASLYLPNGNPIGTEKFSYKLRWMERLKARAEDLLANEIPFVLGGDYNVAPTEGDVYDPEDVASDALVQPETREAWRRLLWLGLTDAFRATTSEVGQFSWWDYRGGGWQKDRGMLIDHLLLSPQAADLLEGAGVDRRPRGWEKASDHTPVWCALKG